jgi:hypothetical protein
MENSNKKIIWLASYPKSGNTWFRSFLTALLNNTEIDINELKTNGIFSSRFIFDQLTDTDSTLLYEEEVNAIIPEVFTELKGINKQEKLFIKIHDAYTNNLNNLPIVPTEATHSAIYFVRNPLDIAASWANHNNSSIENAIKFINNPIGKLAKQKNNFNVNNQFPQLLLSWSGHVESWTNNLPFPVLFLRYEDMLTNTYQLFSKALLFMGFNKTREEIEKAIEDSSFSKLKEQEEQKGFAEKDPDSPVFFRQGIAGNWVNELSKEQVEIIIEAHKTTMFKFGYTT